MTSTFLWKEKTLVATKHHLKRQLRTIYVSIMSAFAMLSFIQIYCNNLMENITFHKQTHVNWRKFADRLTIQTLFNCVGQEMISQTDFNLFWGLVMTG